LVWGPRYIGFGVVCVGGMNRITPESIGSKQTSYIHDQ
jgi:hypothetical protein